MDNSKKLSLWQKFKAYSFNEKWFLIVVALILSVQLFSLIFPILTIVNIGTDNVMAILWWVSVIFALPLLIQNIKAKDFVVYFIVCAIYLISPFFYPDSKDFVTRNQSYFLFQSLPVFFIGLSLTYNRFQDGLLLICRLSLISSIFIFIAYILHLTDSFGLGYDNLEMSYQLLFASLFIFLQAIENHKTIDIILSSVGVLLCLFLGGRGPLICMAFFIIGYLVLFKKFKNTTIARISLILLLLLIYAFSQEIALFLSSISVSLGFSTRIFDSLIQGSLVNINESSGRDELYQLVSSKISFTDHVFGYGFGADRIFTQGWSLQNNETSYVHNIILELMVSVGPYLTIIILGVLLKLIISDAIMLKKDESERHFLFLLFCTCLLPLFFSGSFIHNSQLFLFIGYCLSINRKKLQII